MEKSLQIVGRPELGRKQPIHTPRVHIPAGILVGILVGRVPGQSPKSPAQRASAHLGGHGTAGY